MTNFLLFMVVFGLGAFGIYASHKVVNDSFNINARSMGLNMVKIEDLAGEYSQRFTIGEVVILLSNLSLDAQVFELGDQKEENTYHFLCLETLSFSEVEERIDILKNTIGIDNYHNVLQLLMALIAGGDIPVYDKFGRPLDLKKYKGIPWSKVRLRMDKVRDALLKVGFITKDNIPYIFQDSIGEAQKTPLPDPQPAVPLWGMPAEVYKLRQAGKTDEEIAAYLKGNGWSNTAITALLYEGPKHPNELRDKRQPAKRLLGLQRGEESDE